MQKPIGRTAAGFFLRRRHMQDARRHNGSTNALGGQMCREDEVASSSPRNAFKAAAFGINDVAKYVTRATSGLTSGNMKKCSTTVNYEAPPYLLNLLKHLSRCIVSGRHRLGIGATPWEWFRQRLFAALQPSTLITSGEVGASNAMWDAQDLDSRTWVAGIRRLLHTRRTRSNLQNSDGSNDCSPASQALRSN